MKTFVSDGILEPQRRIAFSEHQVPLFFTVCMHASPREKGIQSKPPPFLIRAVKLVSLAENGVTQFHKNMDLYELRRFEIFLCTAF